MPPVQDGPASSLFSPLSIRGNTTFAGLARAKLSETMRGSQEHAPRGRCVCWGIPFRIDRPVLIREAPVSISCESARSRWLVFLHTSDCIEPEWNRDGFLSPTRGVGRLNEHVADYVVCYEDGAEERLPVRRRHAIGMLRRRWGENCFQAVAHQKPFPVPRVNRRQFGHENWGTSQPQVCNPDSHAWTNWLWAWENPRPGAPIVGFRFEPVAGSIVLSAVSAGNVTANPLRWETRRKAIFRLPKAPKGGPRFDPHLDDKGLLSQIQIDLGQVISAEPRAIYPNDSWGSSHNNAVPEISESEVVIEYTAHRDARFHLEGREIPVTKLEGSRKAGPLQPVAPSRQRVRLRVVEKSSKKLVAVKLHVHGEAGEYLAPVDRHRKPNCEWFEDYAPEFLNQDIHLCTYILGETVIDLPLGSVSIEVSKGLEIRPVRKVVRITPRTRRITLEIERVLPWRDRGWVTADTHVHFLSPPTAHLEGAGEDINVVNLLASQWGELMTNVGDFDGKTTFGSKEAGGDGEYLVRVGTENRQHVLGHISLLGYRGGIIAPMTVGGPDESALGDPVGALLMDWARQCREQGGLVVIPHFPNPRAEHAASMVEGLVDALEMTSWGDLYGGINPYSLSDWYRYLNCGYFVPAVGGTDKMSASTPVGAIRTYAKMPEGLAFTYENWMAAVRSGHTFVSYGPLLEWSVEGKVPGERIVMKAGGGTVDLDWNMASVTMPMARLDVIVNGEIRESRGLKKWEDHGNASLKVERSSWIALLIRGAYPDKPEVIAAHSSPVVVDVEGTHHYAAADALTILEQIEGALAFFDTLGTRAEAREFKRMRMMLVGAHRRLHNRMHEKGAYHKHTPAEDHREHHA